MLHLKVAEAAVVGYPHPIKGQGIYACVTLMAGVEYGDALKASLVNPVRPEIGPIAKPVVVQWAPGLPKTRSGKKCDGFSENLQSNELDSLGDTSTLAGPVVVTDLIKNRAGDS